MKTSYFVTLSTDECENYNTDSEVMANLFTDIFSDASKIAILTKNAELTGCHTEVDVSGGDLLIGRAVVDLEAETRVQLDKTKLSHMMKNAAPWKNCKVEKRAVLEQPSDAVTEDAAVVA